MLTYEQDSSNSPSKLHDWIITPKKKTLQCEQPPKKPPKKPPKVTGPGPITWTVGDIAKAGRILAQPPIPTQFEDEQEMRRVYSLIYDVFRHKMVMVQALNDIAFFLIYPEFQASLSHILLLLYDLYHRSFKKRETAVFATVTQLFQEAGLTEAENTLWNCRTKLAAAVSRLRIQNSALSLSDLLPTHLRNDKIQSSEGENPVTCWVNLRKVKNVNELKTELEGCFHLKQIDDPHPLKPRFYKWDTHCPNIIFFHSSMRPILARSDFIKSHKLIVQDRSFCLGPATFHKHLCELELAGSVIQTHINSPRTTAYLAAILSQNEKITRLMAFSAGRKKDEYENYLNQLGMNNVLVFADRLIDVSPDSNFMEEVVAIFATPPNSYSAVTDPIDLVCSRGGDLSMLEVLTEAEQNEEGKDRVFEILDEQRQTLKFAMSRPQIQFILYETHSDIEAENGGMVDRIVKEVNKNTKLHHATLQGKLTVQVTQDTDKNKEINNNEKLNIEDKRSEISAVTTDTIRLNLNSDEKFFDNIRIPETDMFDIPNLPTLCPGETSCISYTKEGCYLALVQRKQVIRLDNKYMIQMAENRGLFGKTSTSSSKTKGSRASRKKQKASNVPQKSKRRLKEAEMARIAAPTHTFLRHTKDTCDVEKCHRCMDQSDEKKIPIYRQWWSETTRHIINLRTTLIKNKIIPSKDFKEPNAKAVVNSFVSNNVKIDEIVAKSRSESSIPLFPRLKLTRENKVDKVQLLLPVTNVKFY